MSVYGNNPTGVSAELPSTGRDSLCHQAPLMSAVFLYRMLVNPVTALSDCWHGVLAVGRLRGLVLPQQWDLTLGLAAVDLLTTFL